MVGLGLIVCLPLKVVTPGVFTALPGQISAMYVPESAASSDSLKMTVTKEGPSRVAASRIGRVARAIVDYFDGVARAR
jgi:hypothetical protein